MKAMEKFPHPVLCVILLISIINCAEITEINDENLISDIQKIDKYAIVTHDFEFEDMSTKFNVVEGKFFSP